MHRQKAERAEEEEEERRRDDIFIGWQSARASQLGRGTLYGRKRHDGIARLARSLPPPLRRRQIWRWEIGGAFSPSTAPAGRPGSVLVELARGLMRSEAMASSLDSTTSGVA